MANRGGFSWKRFVGVSATKAKISRTVGVPLTRSGRQRKVGKMMGCITIAVLPIMFVLALVLLF